MLRSHINTRVWCENCGKQGHKFDTCPEKSWLSSNVQCTICKQNTHPTYDCPSRKAKRHELTAEEEYFYYMKDIQKKQDARKKYKMITGKEAPRDFDYDKFLAE